MDVSSYMGGSLLTHLDLQQPYQVMTIKAAAPDQVGTDKKICLAFQETEKKLGCNKTNLRRVAKLYGTQADLWPGKQLLVYRTVTDMKGERVNCIRVCGVNEVVAEPIVNLNGTPVAPPQPIFAPQPPVQPVQQQPQPQPDAWQEQAAPQQPAQQPVQTPMHPVEQPAAPQPEEDLAPWEQPQAAPEQNNPPN